MGKEWARGQRLMRKGKQKALEHSRVPSWNSIALWRVPLQAGVSPDAEQLAKKRRRLSSEESCQHFACPRVDKRRKFISLCKECNKMPNLLCSPR